MKTIFSPVLSYISFTRGSGSCATVSADKFKRDVQTLIGNGYSSASLADLKKHPKKEKMFCILLYGGYSNHYEIAFPILKELNVHADTFIPTDLVGKKEYPGIERFIPHFSWEEASEMHQSGLVDIYGMWHPFDEGKDMIAAVRSKAEAIRTNITYCNEQSLFLFPASKHSQDVLPALKNAGMTGYLSDYYTANASDIEAGALPYTKVSFKRGS